MNFLNLLTCAISNMAYLMLFYGRFAFLANDPQLQDIETFCKNKLNGAVLGIDPTYNICNYYVTICTYKNPLLEVSEADRSPVRIGPAITHAQKTF